MGKSVQGRSQQRPTTTACAEKSSLEPVSGKMANMILHGNNRDRNRSASAKPRTCLPARCALETAPQIRAALTDPGLDFFAFPGTCLSEPSAGSPR